MQTPLADTLQRRDATLLTATGTAAGAEQTSRAIEEREKANPFAVRGVLLPLLLLQLPARCANKQKPKYESSSSSSPSSCTSSSFSPVCVMSNQLAASIMPHSNLCRSWVICSTRSFRVLHAGVDTQQPKHPRHPAPSLTAELYASPSSWFRSPRVLLCPRSLVILQVGVNICQARAALSPVHNPQSTCSHSPSTIPFPFWACDFYLFIFVFAAFVQHF